MEYHKGCACRTTLFTQQLTTIWYKMDSYNLCVWSGDNLLKINGRKYKCTIISRRKQPSLPDTLRIKHVWRRYTPTSILESGFNPQLVYASQRIRIMQKSKSTSGYSVPKVLSPCKHYITLTALTDLHPSTSGVIPYFTHCAMKPLSETPIHWPFKGHGSPATSLIGASKLWWTVLPLPPP